MFKNISKKSDNKNKHSLKKLADLKNDKKQQKIYTENVSFMAGLHIKYGCK